MMIQSRRVLVVDDDQETLTLLKMALERYGFSVLTAANWEQVENHVKRVYEENRPIDVIVLDLMMPGQSGFDILRSIGGELVPMPPIIMLTAVTGMAQQLEARDLGVKKYITKPTTPKLLIEAIETVLAAEKPRDFSKNRKLPPKSFTG